MARPFITVRLGQPLAAMVRATLRAHPVTVARVTLAEAAAAVARASRLGAISEAS